MSALQGAKGKAAPFFNETARARDRAERCRDARPCGVSRACSRKRDRLCGVPASCRGNTVPCIQFEALRMLLWKDGEGESLCTTGFFWMLMAYHQSPFNEICQMEINGSFFASDCPGCLVDSKLLLFEAREQFPKHLLLSFSEIHTSDTAIRTFRNDVCTMGAQATGILLAEEPQVYCTSQV